MKSSGASVSITFQPHDKTTRVPAGTSIFNAANWIGLPIDSTCGAMGTCGKCRVQLTEGQAGITTADRQVFSADELAQGWRLSCRASAEEDLICHVPRLLTNPKAALMGAGRHIIVNPNVHKILLTLTPPSLEDQRSDLQRVQDALRVEGFEVQAVLPVLQTLPRLLRSADWQVTAVIVGQQLIGIETGDTRAQMYGLAFDVGTTTVVGMLLNLKTGTAEAVTSELNAQAVYGADVIARISHTMMEADGLPDLQQKILQTLNNLIAKLLNQAQVSADQVYEVMVAGNTTMLHLLLGLDPEAIGVEPFIPVINEMMRVSAQELGLPIYSQAVINLMPHLGAYVGADLVGGLLATGLAQAEKITLLLDIGTNGEMILGSRQRVIASAAPAGPAFEGAKIRDGMRAAPGAIEAVEITSEQVILHTIDNQPPIGICGSGLIDIAAQLLQIGLLEPSGKLVEEQAAAEKVSPDIAARLMTTDDGIRVFVLAWAEESGHGRPIVLTQRDIRELQFARAAISTGIQVLLNEMGISADDLAEIYLAGSFGNYINPRSAQIIGLVPNIPLERIKAIGNAAGEGARIALLSFREREVMRVLPEVVEYHELSGRLDFNDIFMEMLAFPAQD